MADSTAAARPPAAPAAAAAPGLGMIATLYFRDGTINTSSSSQQPTAHTPADVTQTTPAVLEQPKVLLPKTTFTTPAEYDQDGFVKQSSNNNVVNDDEPQQTAVAPEAAEPAAKMFDGETVLPGDKIDATAVRSFSRGAAPHVTVRYCSS
jgi:hypothetical protein